MRKHKIVLVLLLIKRIFSCMNMWLKIAAGVLGGLTIVASMGGFKRNSENNSVVVEEESENSYDNDDIFDGADRRPQRRNNNPSGHIRKNTEKQVRSMQEGLNKASQVIESIANIFNNIIRIFYEDPCYRTNSTLLIY